MAVPQSTTPDFPSMRRLSTGAEAMPEPWGGAHFRVWAPGHERVTIVLEETETRVTLELGQEEDPSFFSGYVSSAKAGQRFWFKVDDSDKLLPDVTSRFQPEGPHGPSQIIDPSRFEWTDSAWPGLSLKGQVFYEMHIGTFTGEGSWTAAAAQLPELASIGVTVLELMPVNEFPGRFGWGYDGVSLFAPYHHYGTPDEFRHFVNAAHACGIGVILDVVYNHMGPDGCYLQSYSPFYFSERYKTDWGPGINFDGPGSGPVREYFTQNAAYWIDEFHLDGLRVDATQNIKDASAEHILSAISRRARRAAGAKPILLVGENEPQHIRLLESPEHGGCGLDMLWNDDFHHSAGVVLTGHKEAYYTDYYGTPQEFISACKRGYLYQGQYYSWQKKRRGSPTAGVAPAHFVFYIENHDQLANSARGLRRRLTCSPGVYRAMVSLLLLGPGTPMLFQGQEFGSTSPFLFFADHREEMAKLVREGRRMFLSQFKSLATPEYLEILPDPGDERIFESCKLDFSERQKHAPLYRLFRDLLRLRKEDPVFSTSESIDGAVLSDRAFALRRFAKDGDDRLLLVNLGPDLKLPSIPEPLVAPPSGCEWDLRFSSEHPDYGGNGTPVLETPEYWCLPGQSALVLIPTGKGA